MEYDSYCSLTEAELARRDIAEINLAAASGLRGAEGLDIAACLARLDEWAELVEASTERWWPKFVRSPEESGGSAAQFRIMAMITVLQRSLGVSYNPASMTGPYNATDSRTHFIHGPLTGFGGTCVSLPVLYLAIGRRLNYPLKLVEAKEHYFAR
ncbi:MAG TPA: hypothetical protein VMV10_18875 [Pirellulales bacterium]|nr:hypothetical protein [Pirellulales bacterium]